MKKLISIILMLVLLAFTGCSDNSSATGGDSDFDYTTDMQYYYNDISNGKLMCTESEKGYYYVGNHNMALFIDKDTMLGTPLCNKANCPHSDPDVCEAYGFGYVQYNNGYLYTNISEYNSERMAYISYIEKVSEDGTQREIITDGIDGTLLEWFIHRDYIYYLTYEGMYSLPLSKPKSEAHLIIDFSELGTVNVDKFIAYQNYVYVSVSALDDGETEDYTDFSHLYAYDISSKDYSEIKHKGTTPEIATFINNSLITYEAVENEESGYDIVYYACDLDGNNREKYAQYPAGNYLYSDGKYIYVDNGAYLENHSDESSEESDDGYFGQTLTVYDLEMNEIDSFKLPFSEWIEMCAQGEECFLLSAYDDDGNDELYCVDKSKIGEYNGSTATKTEVCPTDWYNLTNINSNANVTTVDEENDSLEDCYTSASNKGYKVSEEYTAEDDNITDGFSVTLHWSGDGGNYSGDFQIYEFDSNKSAKKFLKKNKYAFVNGKYAAYASIESIPVEIKKMLVSIIKNDPIDPIEADDFSGKMYTFSQ